VSAVRAGNKSKEPTGTKLALIQAAGELFALKGLKGTSTRAIAGKAGSNIGCIHYYFGGKENLYWAAVEYLFHRRITEQNVALKVSDKPTAQDVSDVLAELVCRRLRAACGPDVPAWHNKLLWRTITDGLVIGRSELIDRVFKPDYDWFCKIVKPARPAISERQMRLLFFQFIGQLIFYSRHQSKVFRELGVDSYGAEDLSEIGAHVAMSLTRMLGLPDPKGSARRAK
jgi:AcrR family transcriptional regulator